MRRRIKPVLVIACLSLFILSLVILKTQHDRAVAREQKARQIAAQKQKEKAKQLAEEAAKKARQANEPLVLKPIIDVSGWQLPSEIDYDVLSANISGAIVRVFGGGNITKANNAAHTTGIDKAFQKHIQEFQKRDVPVAVYSYALGRSEKEMREEARLFYENASPYNPTYYWIDVEEVTMKNLNKGVQAFRDELEKLGAENIGLYIGTYFMEEQKIDPSKFDALWIPAYGDDSGYFNAAPQTKLDYDLHQYTSNGWVAGFSGALDLNQISITSKNTRATYEKLFGPITEKSKQTNEN